MDSVQLEAAIERALGEVIRTDDALGQRVYAALCNVEWTSGEREFGLTWRSASSPD